METILLIDDDEVRSRRLAATLSDGGYGVIAVSSPEEAPATHVSVGLLLNGVGYRQVNGLLRKRNDIRVVHLRALGEPLSADGLLQAVRTAFERPARRGVVLVVDDQQPIRSLIGDFLIAAGYEFLESGNGRHAIDLVRRQKGRVDLVVTDLVMPSAGGLDLTADLMREYPSIKILYISGYTHSIAMDVIARRTPESVLFKPFKEGMLLERVAALLDKP